MAGYAEEGEEDGEAVDEGEENLNGDDGVDEAGEEFAREDGVLFDQFGEVVEAARWGRCQSYKALTWIGGSWGIAGERRCELSIPMARVRKAKPSRTPA